MGAPDLFRHQSDRAGRATRIARIPLYSVENASRQPNGAAGRDLRVTFADGQPQVDHMNWIADPLLWCAPLA